MSRMGLIRGGPEDTGKRGRGWREKAERDTEVGERGADEVREVMSRSGAATETGGEEIMVQG